jgi:hypothetical protein
MTPQEALKLLEDIRADYVAMVNECNAIRRRKHPVLPEMLPIVQRIEKGIRDLLLATSNPKSK